MKKIVGLLVLFLILAPLTFSQERSSANQIVAFAVYRPLVTAARITPAFIGSATVRKVTVHWNEAPDRLSRTSANTGHHLDLWVVPTRMKSREPSILTVTD